MKLLLLHNLRWNAIASNEIVKRRAVREISNNYSLYASLIQMHNN